MHNILSREHTVIALFVVLLAAMPAFVLAQAGDVELRATVREAILSDPRTAGMSEAEIEEMVVALTAEAGAQGVTSADISWRPQENVAEAEPATTACGNMPSFLCALNRAFGFDGSDMTIPIGLVISSALLLFLIGSMLLHHHGHHPVKGAFGEPADSSGVTYQ